MFWVRIDNRLIHGQIIEAWVPFTRSRLLVVANDRVAADALQQEIMSLAIPSNIRTLFVKVEDTAENVASATGGGKTGKPGKSDTLVLFENCADARRAFDQGLGFGHLNVGNLHYSPGKRQVCAHVALSGEDETCLSYFSKKGVELDFRCVPSEPIQVKV